MTPEKHKEADALRKKIQTVRGKLKHIQSSIKHLYPDPIERRILGVKVIDIEYLPPVFLMAYDRHGSQSSEYYQVSNSDEIPRDLLEPLMEEIRKRLIHDLVALELEYGNL